MTAADWKRVLRRNRGLQAMAAVLDEAGVAWTIEDGNKHPKLVFEAGGRTHKHIISTTDALHDGPTKAAADIRRILRAAAGDASSHQQEATVETIEASTNLVVPEIGIIEREGQPLARDVDIAERLGFDRPRDIRKLIVRHMGEIEGFGALARQRGASISGKGRVMDVDEYLLNEEQALLVATLSSAANAPAVRAMLIRTFVAWRRGHLTAPAVGGVSEDLVVGMELVLERLTELSARNVLTEEQMRAFLHTLCERDSQLAEKVIDRIVQAVFAASGKAVKSIRGPAGHMASDDEIDIDGAYKAFGLAEHLPARRRLSVVVGNRLDAYCRDRRIVLGTVIALGQRVRTWPRQAALAWFAEGGRDFIAEHVRRHTVDAQGAVGGQGVITFPGGAR